MLYSSYHATNPRYEFFSPDNNSALSKPKHEMQDIIRDIGRKNHKVGIFYDHKSTDFSVYIIRRLFAVDENRAQIVDFLFRRSAFVDNLYDFDIMIYITKSKMQWTDKMAFTEFIQRFNSDFSVYVDVSDNFIDALVSQKKEFKLVNHIKFQTGKNDESLENVYVYKRRK